MLPLLEPRMFSYKVLLPKTAKPKTIPPSFTELNSRYDLARKSQDAKKESDKGQGLRQSRPHGTIRISVKLNF